MRGLSKILSEKFGGNNKKQYLCIRLKQALRSLRLSVRTRDFHSLKRSSTLLRATNNIEQKEIKIKMANHNSCIKRIRQTKTRTEHNKYYAKTMRNAVRKLRATTDKDEATNYSLWYRRCWTNSQKQISFTRTRLLT